MRRQVAPGARLPVETEVLLVLDGPGMLTIWTAPTERVEATRVGRLTGAAGGAYETVRAGVPVEESQQPGRVPLTSLAKPPADWVGAAASASTSREEFLARLIRKPVPA
jgi:hypothetical protein